MASTAELAIVARDNYGRRVGDRTPARRAAHAYSQAWYAACTDARLMRAACDADDQRAFEELVVRHQDRLYTFARRLTGDSQADAAECVQDAFLAAWRGRREWRGEASVTTWLYSITRRKALDKLRQRDGA